jgi:hypothetical protein
MSDDTMQDADIVQGARGVRMSPAQLAALRSALELALHAKPGRRIQCSSPIAHAKQS